MVWMIGNVVLFLSGKQQILTHEDKIYLVITILFFHGRIPCKAGAMFAVAGNQNISAILFLCKFHLNKFVAIKVESFFILLIRHHQKHATRT